jgi:parallel beta-helix repeat protein
VSFRHRHDRAYLTYARPWKIYLKLALAMNFLFVIAPTIVFAPAAFAEDKESSPNPQSANIIHVNPKTGNDRSGDGSEASPFKTITQALMLAKSQTVIQLAPGTYSSESGENFPLIVRTDVSIKGNLENQGADVIINGNGTFISPTSAGQNATIVLLYKGGEISGLTVTNPNSMGYALWIESASPTVTKNTFSRSGNAGVSVNGNSAPLIANNYFYSNMGNGMVIYGNSQPQVKDNIFERTGFGVSVMDSGAPILTGNRISNNRIGVILQKNSQAKLRNNKIDTSLEDGVVAVSNARPDLGTAKDPGQNKFSGNRGLDIRNLAREQTIPAFGNQLASSYEGKIDLDGTVAGYDPAAAVAAAKLPPTKLSIALNPSSANNNSIKVSPPQPLQAPSLPPEEGSQKPTESSTGKEITFSAPQSTSQPTNSGNAIGGGKPLPPPPILRSPESAKLPPLLPPDRPSAISSNTNTNPLPPVNPSSSLDRSPPPSTTTPANRKNLSQLLVVNPNSSQDVLPVPDASIPSGNIGKTSSSGYRVVIQTLNNQQLEQLRSIYPDAFSTKYNGQSVWQVGVFSSEEGAERALSDLNNLGLSGLIVR